MCMAAYGVENPVKSESESCFCIIVVDRPINALWAKDLVFRIERDGEAYCYKVCSNYLRKNRN